MVTIGFVGLGVMGGTIARRLLRAGYAVQGYNRTLSKATALQGSGLTPQPTPRDAAHGAAVVFSMVSDGDALAQVCAGQDGLLQGLGPDSIHVDLSTVGPVASESARIAAREHGSRFLAAPVSGSVSTIEEGRLSFMVGGDEQTLDSVRPVLLDIGPVITHVGTVEQAAAMKMAVNLSVAIQMIAFSEGVLLAERYGIEPDRSVDVLLHSVIASPMLAYRGRFLLDPPKDPWFTVALGRKDLRIMLDMAERVDLPLWSVSAAAPILAAAEALGYGQAELASVAEALRTMSGGAGCTSG